MVGGELIESESVQTVMQVDSKALFAEKICALAFVDGSCT